MNLDICHNFREVYLVLSQHEKYFNLAWSINQILLRSDLDKYSLKSFKQVMRFKDTTIFDKSGINFDTKTHLVKLTRCLEVNKKSITMLFHEDGKVEFNVMRDRTHLASGTLHLEKKGDEHLLDNLLNFFK